MNEVEVRENSAGGDINVNGSVSNNNSSNSNSSNSNSNRNDTNTDNGKKRVKFVCPNYPFCRPSWLYYKDQCWYSDGEEDM